MIESVGVMRRSEERDSRVLRVSRVGEVRAGEGKLGKMNVSWGSEQKAK